MKRILWMMLAMALVAGFAGCGDDDPVKPKVTPPSDYEDLSEDWHVLANLETAYDKRNVNRLDELLDAANFVFYFNPGDVGGGIPSQWGYAEEKAATTNMFTGRGGSQSNPILSINLTLDMDDAVWSDVTDDPDFPGETLRRTVVEYGYFIDTQQDRQLITAGAPRAQLTMRETDGKWKIVKWADLEGTFAARATASSTEESMWGQVKVLYRGE